MSEPSFVECATHGRALAAYVCHHLVGSLRDETTPGVSWLRDSDGNVNAWCDECDENLNRHGGEWNDETEGFAKISLICEGCFDRLTQMNPTKDLN